MSTTLTAQSTLLQVAEEYSTTVGNILRVLDNAYHPQPIVVECDTTSDEYKRLVEAHQHSGNVTIPKHRLPSQPNSITLPCKPTPPQSVTLTVIGEPDNTPRLLDTAIVEPKVLPVYDLTKMEFPLGVAVHLVAPFVLLAIDGSEGCVAGQHGIGLGLDSKYVTADNHDLMQDKFAPARDKLTPFLFEVMSESTIERIKHVLNAYTTSTVALNPDIATIINPPKPTAAKQGRRSNADNVQLRTLSFVILPMRISYRHGYIDTLIVAKDVPPAVVEVLDEVRVRALTKLMPDNRRNVPKNSAMFVGTPAALTRMRNASTVTPEQIMGYIEAIFLEELYAIPLSQDVFNYLIVAEHKRNRVTYPLYSEATRGVRAEMLSVQRGVSRVAPPTTTPEPTSAPKVEFNEEPTKPQRVRKAIVHNPFDIPDTTKINPKGTLYKGKV